MRWLMAFLARANIIAADAARLAAQGQRTGKIIVSGRRDVQHPGANGPTKTIYGDMISHASLRGEADLALDAHARVDVIIARDEGEAGQRVAGINGEKSIEITALGADHHGLGVIRRPGVPYRMATGIARMAGLEWFFRRTAIEHLSAPG